MLTDKLPPQNIEAEESVLCSLLCGETEPLNLLKPEDFYRTAHQTIFRAASDILNAGQNIDVLTVKTALIESGKIDDIGGGAYLADLLNAPVAINMEHYCKIIREKCILRRLLEVPGKIFESVYGGGDTAEIVDQIQQIVLQVDGVSASNCFDVRENIIPAMNRWQNLKERKGGLGLMSAFIDIYRMTGNFQAGDLVVIAGRPSMGKSAMALSIAVNASQKKIPGAFFSLEMSSTQIEDRVAAIVSKVNGKKFQTGDFTKENWVKLIEAIEKIGEWPFIYDDTPAMTYHQIRQKARMFKSKYGIKYIVVDYLQLMQGDRGKNTNRDREIASITGAMKQTAKELKIPVILLSQLNRDVEKRTNKRPMLSDLRESGSIEQDADIVMFLYRDEYYDIDSADKGQTEVNIAKHRNGPTGTVKVSWLPEIAKFENLTTHYEQYQEGR